MSRTKPPPFMRPHQKRERLQDQRRGGFRSYRRVREETIAHPDDAEYWAWRPVAVEDPEWGDHVVEWRPRPYGIRDPVEAISTMQSGFGPATGSWGPTGSRVTGSMDEEESEEATRKEVRECRARSDSDFLKGVSATRVAQPTSPPCVEVRCRACGAGGVRPVSGETVESGLEEVLGLLRAHWDGKTCEEVRETLTVLTVLES